tara:strand:- start:1199 stop:1420 length:222 start_codon:yes stop_codon:yes gene_type:complete
MGKGDKKAVTIRSAPPTIIRIQEFSSALTVIKGRELRLYQIPSIYTYNFLSKVIFNSLLNMNIATPGECRYSK